MDSKNEKCTWKITNNTKQEIIKIKQEDLSRTTWRSWRTLWMYEFFENFMQILKHAIDTKLITWLKTQRRTQKYFWFLWFYYFFVFSFNFFENHLKKKNKDSKIFNMNSRNLMLFNLKLQSKGQAWLNSQPSFSM